MLKFAAPTWPLCPPRKWQTAAFEAVVKHYAAEVPEPAVVSAIMGAGKSLLVREVCATVELKPGEVVVVSTSTELLVEDLFAAIRERCGFARHIGTWYGRRKRLGDIVVCCIPSVPALSAKLQAAGRRVALWIADECHKTECSTILDDFKNLSPAHSLGLTATPFRSDLCEAISLFGRLIYRYGVAEAQADEVVCPWRIVHAQAVDGLDRTCLDLVRDAKGPGLANATDIEDAEGFAAYLNGQGVPTKAIHSRLMPRDRRRVLRELRDGALRCAVHVNLLAEGANYPWLRWLLLRRQVESRVRFVQEIGRLLRSHPGKGEATFYDPHDLFGNFQLGYAEALGEPPEKPEWEGPIDPMVAAERLREANIPVALAWIESVIRCLVVACDAAGLMGGRKTIAKAERLKPATELQCAALRSGIERARGAIPAGWRTCLRAVADRPDGLRFGFAADLIAALSGIVKGNRWPPIDGAGRISAAPAAEPVESAPPERMFPALVGVGGQLHVDWSRL